MLLSKLPDGCSSQDYADKCNGLLTNHLPYFKTIRLEGELLSETYLDFFPEALKSVAAGIKDGMREKGTFNNPDAVMARAKRNVGNMSERVRVGNRDVHMIQNGLRKVASQDRKRLNRFCKKSARFENVCARSSAVRDL
jgi:hypothetical protein